MFENYLLNKYSKYIEGFAYEIIYSDYRFDIITYFVLKKDNELKFIKYRTYKNLNVFAKDDTINDLQKLGYESFESIIKVENEKNNKRRLFKVLKK